MDIKKIKIKKSGTTITGVVIILVLLMGMFYGLYTYIEDNASSAGISIDSKYEGTYANLSVSQDNLHSKVEGVKGNVTNIAEAEGSWVVNAWNGLKGLGKTIALIPSFLTTMLLTYTSFLGFGSEFMPTWVFGLVSIGLTAFLILLGLRALKGEPAV